MPNPFFGIITDPTSALSREQVQLGQLLKQNPQFTSRVASIPPWQGPTGNEFQSNFESLQVGFKKASAAGLTLQAAYTLSKFLTNVDSYEAGFPGPNTPPQNNVTIEGEKSLSSEDTSHRLVTGWLYELPFGRGQRFDAGMPPVADKILGGWEVSGILTLSSGLPLGDLGVTPDRSGSYTDASGGFVARLRPDLLREPCLSHSRPRGERLLRYIDENAFGFTEPFKFGSAPRTLPRCRGDGWKNFDVSITKNIVIRESIRTEFRAEFFNLFNRPQLKHPNMIVGSGSFGQITAQENQPRIIQFALRVHF